MCEYKPSPTKTKTFHIVGLLITTTADFYATNTENVDTILLSCPNIGNSLSMAQKVHALQYRVSQKICYNPGNSTLSFCRLVLFFPGVA